jgi:hypothetical protein
MSTVEEAARVAQESGEEVTTVKDEAGQEFVQRPISITTTKRTRKPRKKAGGRVKVYNRRGGAVFASDCHIGPHDEGTVLQSDLDASENLRDWLLIIK